MIAESDKLPWLAAVCVVLPQLPYFMYKVPRKGFRGAHNLHTGFCYAASEAIYHLSADPLEPWWLRYGPRQHQTHWFLRHAEDPDLIIDVTASQFSDVMLYDLYSRSRRRAFGSKEPSRRAQMILDKCSRRLYFQQHFSVPLEDMTPDGYPWHVRRYGERRAGDSNTSRRSGRHA